MSEDIHNRVGDKESLAVNRVKSGWFMMFEAKYSEESVGKRFIEKYGYEPSEVIKSGPIWMVGPIREVKGESES